MKWIVKLVTETAPGHTVEQEIAILEREDLLAPASAGLSIAEGKGILENLQKHIVAAQVQHHNRSLQSCSRCGRSFRTKGYYQSTLRSVYGHVPMRVRRLRGCSCTGTQHRTYSTIFTHRNPITPELRYLTAKLAALMPFGKVTDFLSELLPLSAKMTASTVRNRTLKVGKRLQKSADELAAPPQREPCPEAVVGLDGAYVRACHPRPERNFEVVVGKVMDKAGHTTRLAAVRTGGPETIEATRRALRQHGVEKHTTVTMFTDGDTGLRAIQRHVAPQAEHVLDWFHIGMKFQNLKQVAKGINGPTDGSLRHHASAQLERVKWRFWHGQVERGLIGLVRLRQWAHARCFGHIPAMAKLGHVLLDVIRYLEANADSLPNYGRRYRAGRRISTAFAESAVNEIIARRMTKKQQMRWNRHTVQSFLNVRVHVLNDTLEDAFRHWHKGFRPSGELAQFATAA
jgi:hypothetical protein